MVGRPKGPRPADTSHWNFNECVGEKQPASFSTMSASIGIAYGLYVFDLSHDLFQKVCNLSADHDRERLPSIWNPMIEKESLRLKDLEHDLIEKADQHFRDTL